MVYSIKEAGKKLGLSVHALRYYEKAGLTPDIARNAAGNRVFTESDISWIYLVCRLRDINMPIQYIRDYILMLKNPDSTLSDRRFMIEAFKKEIDETLKKYLTVQKLIDKKLEFYDNAASTEKTEADVCYDYRTDWEHFISILEED